MPVTLTPDVEAMIRDKVDGERYVDASDVVREAMRLMDERDRKLKALRDAVAEADEQIARGEFVEWTPELRATLKKEAAELVRQGHRPHPDVCP